MIRKRLAAVVAAASVAALVLSGCSGGGGDVNAQAKQFTKNTKAEISFAWWGNNDRADKFKEAISLFNKKYPNIKVTRSFASFGDYWTARNTEAAGRTLPDLMMMDANNLSEYSRKHLLQDLSPLRKNVMPLDGLSDSALSVGKANGELDSIPLGTNAWSMMYNKDLLDKLKIAYPTDHMTWSELKSYVRKVDQAGASAKPSEYGSSDFTGSLPGFIYWRMQQGKGVFTKDGKPAFTQQDVVDYVDSVKDLRADGKFFPIKRNAALSPKDGFLAGQYALWFNFSTTLLQAMTDSGTNRIGIVPAPGPDGVDQHVLATHPSLLLSVSANSQQKAAAAALLNFLVTSPGVAKIFGTSLGVPETRQARAAAAKVNATPADAPILQYARYTQSQQTPAYPSLPAGYGTIETKWGDLHQQLSYGKIDSRQFAQQLFDEMSVSLGN
ncbi:ABC transporter substrate-binding protein [Actinocatenispora thailandica]|uniref:ABC transporter substrate-binding protein n=1 Tax=Actinocatenispora thailandica TaxID=227318 RepID=A0A7R7HXL0_9ACTN|nr:extracellular solute-binding protein [Actinocatenispora thailandica]BCJ36292.1 ABC transporter substrate-binding protein [Actinocatenispora thailandica]